MSEKLESYRKFVFMAIVIIAMGVTLTSTMEDPAGALGTVLIAVGGLFFIIGMSKKRKADEREK